MCQNSRIGCSRFTPTNSRFSGIDGRLAGMLGANRRYGLYLCISKQGITHINFTIMRKIMFLAVVLSAIAIGSASANDGDRRPNGVVFGVGGNGGYVAVSVGGPEGPRHHREYRGECDRHNYKRVRRDNHRGCDHGKRWDKRHKRCNKGHHHGAYHPRPHRPGMHPHPPVPRRF